MKSVSDAVAALPPLRTVIEEHDLRAKKALGQNFLLDLNLTRKIARAVDGLGQGTVIEVGPGPGGLTRALLLEGAKQVVAIERDRRAVAALDSLVLASAGSLLVVEGDALAFDYAALPAPRRVVANLPYNIGTPLLLDWLRHIRQFASLTLMFQKEVADRIVARPRTESYGRLSVMAQWRCEVTRLFDIPARAFTPAPKVDSTVVQFIPRVLREGERNPAWSVMERVVAAAFGQRRKMLRSALKPIGDVEELCASAEISGSSRAEELDVEDFIRLSLHALPPPLTPKEEAALRNAPL